jgi:hypothetical protein
MKRKKIEDFFKSVESGSSSSQPNTEVVISTHVQEPEQNHPMSDASPREPRIGSLMYERDPGKHRQQLEYPQNERDGF